MKRLLSLLHCRHLHLGILAIVCLSIFTSCDETPGNSNGGTPSEPSESQSDKWDMPIGIQLFYNASNFLDNYKQRYGGSEPSDWRELSYTHGIQREGELFFENLLPINMGGYGWPDKPEYRPEIRFDFWLTGKSEMDKPVQKKYTAYNDSLMVFKIVHDAPIPNYYQTVCDFHARTIITSKNHLCLKWEYSTVLQNKDSMNNMLLLEGDVKSVSVYTKSTTGEDEVAIREAGRERVVVENTVPFHLRGKTVSLRLLSTRAVISDVLSQPVIKGGRVSLSKWKEPKIAKIQSK